MPPWLKVVAPVDWPQNGCVWGLSGRHAHAAERMLVLGRDYVGSTQAVRRMEIVKELEDGRNSWVPKYYYSHSQLGKPFIVSFQLHSRSKIFQISLPLQLGKRGESSIVLLTACLQSSPQRTSSCMVIFATDAYSTRGSRFQNPDYRRLTGTRQYRPTSESTKQPAVLRELR